MGRSCMAFGCRGNYKGEPYSKMVNSWDKKSKEDWIAAKPNDPESQRDKDKIWLCVTHFEGEWISSQGGRKPKNIPTIFPGIPKSCIKQSNSKPRETKRSSSAMRQKNSEENDKIKFFNDFSCTMRKKYPKFQFIQNGEDLRMFRIDEIGRVTTGPGKPGKPGIAWNLKRRPGKPGKSPGKTWKNEYFQTRKFFVAINFKCLTFIIFHVFQLLTIL